MQYPTGWPNIAGIIRVRPSVGVKGPQKERYEYVKGAMISGLTHTPDIHVAFGLALPVHEGTLARVTPWNARVLADVELSANARQAEETVRFYDELRSTDEVGRLVMYR